jgi:HEAT repeat protein
VGRGLGVALLLAGCTAGAVLWYVGGTNAPLFRASVEDEPKGTWLDRLCSRNPRVSKEAEGELLRLGDAALPELRAALTDPNASAERRKGALRAASLLGAGAAPALSEVASHLTVPEYTAEAALALSVMGAEAYRPLADALTSTDAEVRKEALRSLGKLQQRAPLDPDHVVPALLDALADRDPGVRAIAATYVGIIHEDPGASVPALIEMLKDEDAGVRTAAARALGSFGAAGAAAIPALRRAQGDKDEAVAREAGVSIVKLQTQ